MSLLHTAAPRLPRRGLLFVASFAWGVAGTILFYRGTLFLLGDTHHFLIRIFAGIAGGVLFFYLLFRRISLKHMARIRSLEPERPCMFSFLDWRGYMLMSLMIGMGIALRSFQIVPPANLGMFYIAMGTPLLFSSARFFHGGVRYTSSYHPRPGGN